MLAQLNTFALLGIDAIPVQVEVDTAPAQMPKTVLVGLPELTVRESIHRIERALVNLGYRLPNGRTIVNLAPADLRKDAGAFDLPIALGILVSTGQIIGDHIGGYAMVGELALDGSVRPIAGAISMAMEARSRGATRLIVPAANAREAAVVREVEVYGVNSLVDAVGIIVGAAGVDPISPTAEEIEGKLNKYEVDFTDVKGQEFAKRALIVAASGCHNVLMLGSPGSGKTMLARRLPTILPPLSPDESLETTRIYSAVGRLSPGESLLSTRPFRSPHHTISDAGMVGGGTIPQPGEISLSHHGVLFLDELPEFNRRSLESLRQPLEEGKVTISRAAHSTTFPADFVLIAAMNPCPCGFLGDPKHVCKCSPIQVEKYMGRVSGLMQFFCMYRQGGWKSTPNPVKCEWWKARRRFRRQNESWGSRPARTTGKKRRTGDTMGTESNEKKRKGKPAAISRLRRKKLILFGWYGGKFSHLDWLLPLLPKCHHFCEPFAGSGAVLLNRPPSAVETYNDLDGEVVNFFRVLRDNGDEIKKAIALTPFSREEFALACTLDPDITDVERARRFYIRARQVRTGLAQTATLGRWANCKDTSRAGMSGVISRWLGGVEQLDAICQRLIRVQIENRPAVDVIKLYDSTRTLFYCDPPYVHETRGDAKAYKHEMTDEQHEELADTLNAAKGKVAFSNYDCELLERLYPDSRWHKTYSQPKTNHSTKSKRVEVLWTNYAPSTESLPPNLFNE